MGRCSCCVACLQWVRAKIDVSHLFLFEYINFYLDSIILIPAFVTNEEKKHGYVKGGGGGRMERGR